jgi:hypothetical protein
MVAYAVCCVDRDLLVPIGLNTGIFPAFSADSSTHSSDPSVSDPLSVSPSFLLTSLLLLLLAGDGAGANGSVSVEKPGDANGSLPADEEEAPAEVKKGSSKPSEVAAGVGAREAAMNEAAIGAEAGVAKGSTGGVAGTEVANGSAGAGEVTGDGAGRVVGDGAETESGVTLANGSVWSGLEPAFFILVIEARLHNTIDFRGVKYGNRSDTSYRAAACTVGEKTVLFVSVG